jgi:hypothetical protein
MIDGYAKDDPPTLKMLPVETDVPELLVAMGYISLGTTHTKAIGDLSMIAFYYLLRIGEYTVKGKRKNTNKRYSSNSKTMLSSKRLGLVSYAVYPEMHRTNSFCQPIVPPLSSTTRKMSGRECVFTRRQMATISITRSEHSGKAMCIYVLGFI